MSGDNGKTISEPAEEVKPQAQATQDPERVVNSVTIMEIKVNLLANGKERTEVIAHEFMMTEHKGYMIDKLCEALVRISRGIIKGPDDKFIKNYPKEKRLYFSERISEAIKMCNRAVKRTPVIKRLPGGMNQLRQFLAQKRR